VTTQASCVCALAESGDGVSGHLGYYHLGKASLASSNSAQYIATTARSAGQYWPLHGMTTFDLQSFTAVAQSSTNSPTREEMKARVENQLDEMSESPVLGRFVLLGPSERRRGGVILSFCVGF
jgi:hypothetical protein